MEANQAPPLLTALERGALQFPSASRALSSQFTQTELMKIATAYLGTKAIHSSTIGGVARGVLTEPAPKTFLALGAFNLLPFLLRSPRVYKPGMTHDEAKRIIVEGRGAHFDPMVVDAFLETEAEFVRTADELLPPAPPAPAG